MRRTRITTLATAIAATSLLVASGIVSAQSPAASMAAGSAGGLPTTGLKIGVVTDIGTLDDKNFNEYTFKGAQDGAAAIGADRRRPPSSPRTPRSTRRTSSSSSTRASTSSSRRASTWPARPPRPPTTTRTSGSSASTSRPSAWTPRARPTPTSRCEGDAADAAAELHRPGLRRGPGRLPRRHRAPRSISKTGSIGAIGGTSACAPCVRYIQGYELGAQSVNPDIKVKAAYVVKDFSNAAFNDPTGGNNFAQQFLPVPEHRRDVPGRRQDRQRRPPGRLRRQDLRHRRRRRPVAVAQRRGGPDVRCIVTSAEKHLQSAVSQAIQAIAGGTAAGGDARFNATNDGIGVSDFHDKASLITPDDPGPWTRPWRP